MGSLGWQGGGGALQSVRRRGGVADEGEATHVHAEGLWAAWAHVQITPARLPPQPVCAVRLRPARDASSFLPFESILGTMLHELVHNVRGPHDRWVPRVRGCGGRRCMHARAARGFFTPQRVHHAQLRLLAVLPLPLQRLACTHHGLQAGAQVADACMSLQGTSLLALHRSACGSAHARALTLTRAVHRCTCMIYACSVFYKLLDEITAECEELMAKGVGGTGIGFDAPSMGRLGSHGWIPTHNPPEGHLRDHARKVRRVVV